MTLQTFINRNKRSRSRKVSAVYCFKHWNNKSYSVFNSLNINKCFMIGVLCVTYSILNPPVHCMAQADTAAMPPMTVDLDEVAVTATRAPNVFSPAGRTISRISLASIAQAPAQNLTDILKYAPNVDLRQRGPNGTQADVSIRGSSFDQTVVLLNGINISDPQTGHYSMNIPVDIESVDRIEILEGPASRVFGANALGGVVNIITGTKPGNSINASVAGGEYGFRKASANATVHSKHTTHHASATKMASDGYIPNTDFDIMNAFSQNRWKNSVMPLDVQLGYTAKNYGANGFYGARYPNQYEELNTFIASAKGESTGRVKISPAVYWRRNNDYYVLARENPEAYRNFHRTDVYGAEVHASRTGRIGKTTLGLLYRNERILSSALGMETSSPRPVPHHNGAMFTKADSRSSSSLFAEQNIHAGKWNASLGALLNSNSYQNRAGVYPGIDLSYRAGIFKIYASANRAMRLPTFTDLYYQGPTLIGNTGLKPEYSTEYEAGVNASHREWSAVLSYFNRQTNDAIDWIWLGDAQKWHTQNLTDLSTNGISASGEWNAAQHAGNTFFIRSAGMSLSFITIGKHAGSYNSYYVLDYLKHQANFRLTHRIFENICAQWHVKWQDRNGTYMNWNADSGTETEEPYSPFWQVDLRIYRRVERWSIFAESTNLGNIMHQDIGNIMLPGRWIRCGASVSFKL
ncbi:MAG: TonB-dependent receptor [Bacteroidales bacterium]|nr:TonB-dependent receptor [Bacteroidales bacterium]